MSERFTVEVDITAKDSTGSALKSTKTGFQEAFGEVATGALRKAGEGLTDFARQIPGMVVDLAKLGVSVQTNQRRFEQFAGGAERAEMFLKSFNEGTGNTVDRMAAMSSSARLLQMGLVTTGDEMSQIASIATKLGNQTMGAGERIADFAALLANQSTPRLDNFGISSGRVKLRIDELLKSGQALNREQAFKMAVMEEGAKSLDTLGDVSELTSTKMEVLTAALKTAKQGFGEILAEDIASLAGDIESTGEAVRILPEAFRAWREERQKMSSAVRLSNEEVRASRQAMQEEREAMEDARAATRAMTIDIVTGAESQEQYQRAMQDANAALDQLAISSANYVSPQERLRLHTELVAAATGDSAKSFDQYTAAIEGAERATDDASFAMMNNAKRQEELRRSAFELAASFTGQFEQMHDDSRRLNDQRITEEEKHQGKLADLRQRGQARAIRIDEDAETEKLRNLREKLGLALLDQGAFTDKTKEATRKRKEITIRNLNEEIAEQERLLDDHRAGRLWAAGENVDDLIAEEQRRHDESIALTNDQMAQQEEAQRQATGRMVLQAFEAWVETNDISDEKAQALREQIQLDYGLISEDVLIQTQGWQQAFADYASGATTSLGEVIKEVERSGQAFVIFKQKIDAIPREVIIKIREELQTATRADPTRMGGETMQSGTGFAPGGLAMVGERGPEMAFIPRGAQVFPTDQSRHMTQNFNLSVNSPSTSMGVQNDFGLMESLAAA